MGCALVFDAKGAVSLLASAYFGDRGVDDLLRLGQNGFQMILTAETLRVDLVDILCP